MLRNRSFEDSLLPDGCITNDNGKTFTSPTGWIDEFNNNDGSSEAPLKTISEAARRAVAGTKVVIHQGTYRECVRPQAGGEGPEKMVLYEAAGDGDVVIKASEEVTEFEKSTGWIYMNHRIITTRHFPADKFTSIWKY